jgi:hypothetical protein
VVLANAISKGWRIVAKQGFADDLDRRKALAEEFVVKLFE